MGGFPWTSPKVTHRITTHETFPDHVFVLCAPGTSTLGEIRELAPDQPIINTQGAMLLFIVPRTEATPYKTTQELVEALKGGCARAALRHQFSYKESVPFWSGDEFTVEYRVQWTPSGGIELVRTTANQEGAPCCVAAVLMTMATFGGLWLTRRKRKRKNLSAEVK
jgi:hypothetical protein